MDAQQFGTLFGPYMAPDGQWQALAEGIIEQLDVNHGDRAVGIVLRLPRLVAAETLFAAEKEVAAALHMASAAIRPLFPGELLGDESGWPSLVEHLRRRNVAVNGTLDDARFLLEENALTVECVHGGVNILSATATEALLETLILEQFGRRVKVTFAGEEVPCDDEHNRQMQSAGGKTGGRACRPAPACHRNHAGKARQARRPHPPAGGWAAGLSGYGAGAVRHSGAGAPGSD